MNGLVILNKPKGKTSRDVVNKLTHLLGIKKIGHTGTLDPIAIGVLVCLIGKYTKLVPLITSYNKEYIAEIKLGIKTDTEDITGKIIEEQDFNVTKDDILDVFEKFPKNYKQQVPIYSAVKINGKKLYEYARNNECIDLPTRNVDIKKLELLDFTDDIVKFKACVSKGTYIRSLITDICNRLNTIGTMNNLIRTKQGNFYIENSSTLEDIENNNYQLLNIKEFLDYPVIEIPNELLKMITNGSKIDNKFNIQDKVIFTYQNKDIAIYEKKDDILRPFVML